MVDARCLIYTRVSSDEQRQKGYSLDFQYKEILEYCKKSGLTVVKHFTESHTAKKPGRPDSADQTEIVTEILQTCKNNKKPPFGKGSCLKK